jgi:hypothetical protein
VANRIFRPLVDWVIRNRAEIARYGWPVFLFETFNWTFDHLAFPGGMKTWGPVNGVLIITAAALVLNSIFFLAYEVMKIDWLQAKYLRDREEAGDLTQIETALTKHRRFAGDRSGSLRAVLHFIGLTALVDPVIIAVHYRNEYFKGVSGRDWGILVAATLSACIIWSFLWGAVWTVLLLIGKLLAWYFGTPAY